MARENKTGADAAPKTYYYKICGHCGEKAHIDSAYCVKCGARIDAPGAVKRFYESAEPAEVERLNLDHPNGCPACGLGCRYCFSFGAKEPHPKAYCGHCGKTGKERPACCINARKLPNFFDVVKEELPDVIVSLSDVFDKSETGVKIRETWAKLYAEEVEKCWSHIKAAAEVDKSLSWLKRGA